MLFNLSDYNCLPESSRRSLTCLRAIRDNLVDRITGDARDVLGEDALELIEDLCGVGYRNSAYHRLQQAFTGRIGAQSNLDLLDVLKAVVDRIAELERACWSGLEVMA